MKNIYLIIILLLSISCKNQEEKKVNQGNHHKYNDSTTIPISKKWHGKYSLLLNENSDDWRDIHEISITINKDSITYMAEGFQLYHFYLLSAVEKKNSLKLFFKKRLDNTDSWALKKTKDFGTIAFENKNYIWKSPYIDISYNDNKYKPYLIKKN